jgi:hypothetical protein
MTDYPQDFAQDRADALGTADDLTYRDRLSIRLASERVTRAPFVSRDLSDDNSAFRGRRDAARWVRNLAARDETGRLYGAADGGAL